MYLIRSSEILGTRTCEVPQDIVPKLTLTPIEPRSHSNLAIILVLSVQDNAKTSATGHQADKFKIDKMLYNINKTRNLIKSLNRNNCYKKVKLIGKHIDNKTNQTFPRPRYLNFGSQISLFGLSQNCVILSPSMSCFVCLFLSGRL